MKNEANLGVRHSPRQEETQGMVDSVNNVFRVRKALQQICTHAGPLCTLSGKHGSNTRSISSLIRTSARSGTKLATEGC